MATLSGSTIASTYDRLLALPSGGLNGTTLVALTDGNASATISLQVATTKTMIEGSGNKLFFGDEGGEYIYGDTTDLRVYSGADILLMPTGNVGIGTTTPDGILHVANSDITLVTPWADADEFIVAGPASANAGMSILTADANDGNLVFGSPADATGARIAYNHAAATLHIRTAKVGHSLILGGDNQIPVCTMSGASGSEITSFVGKVGIGTASPTEELSISASSNPTIVLTNTDSTVNDGDDLGSIYFSGQDGTGAGTSNVGAAIFGEAAEEWEADSNVNHTPAELSFWTSADDTSAMAQRMTIDKDGLVGIGTAAPHANSDLHIYDSGAVGLYIESSDNNQPWINLKRSGASHADWGIINNSAKFQIGWSNDMTVYTDIQPVLTCLTTGTGNGNVGIGTDAPEGLLEVGDMSTLAGGMIFKTLDVPEDTATTFYTIAGSNLWAGTIEITWHASDDTNRSGYQLSRFGYDDTFTSLIASSQNCGTPTLTLAGGANMQFTLEGAGSTVYKCKFRIVGGLKT